MAEGPPPAHENPRPPTFYVQQLSIENSYIRELNIRGAGVPEGAALEADEAHREQRDTESDVVASPLCQEFPKNKDWSRLSHDVVMYTAAPLRPNRELYKARQRHASDRVRDVIVKLIHTSEERKKELDCLLKLSGHPNVIKILESGNCRELVPRIYIVMEQCHQNLNDYIKGNKFQLMKASSFFRQLVAAIVYIHQNEIAHHGLKPSNILIAVDGNTLKVSDFGSSKEYCSDPTKLTEPHQDAPIGGFKAPEMYHRTQLGYKADIFSSALNGYYIFTHGGHPYGPNPLKQAVGIMENAAPNLSLLPKFRDPSKKTQLMDLLGRMLQHEPDKRPTAEQVQKGKFFKGQKAEESFIPASEEARCDRSEPTERCEAAEDPTNTQVVECSKELDVSGILAKYDAILQPQEATKLSNSLTRATQMLQQKNSNGAISILKDSIPEDLSALDIKDFAFMLKEEGHYMYALLMYHASNMNFKTRNASPDNSLKWFGDLVSCIRYSALPLIRHDMGNLRDVATTYSIELLNNLLQDIHELVTSNEEDKVLTKASCIVSISRISIDGKLYQSSIDACNNGLHLLGKQFKGKTYEHKYYGQLLNNIGEALMHSGNCSSAEGYFERALKAKKAAKYGSRNMKRRDTQYTHKNLMKCQDKLDRS